MNPVPIGVVGELFAGGDGLALGYWNSAGLTTDRFIPNPISKTPGDRLYRTGDLCRWMTGGIIEFVGRADDQVKIRGFRVELGEVETALLRHPAVVDAAVLARPGSDGMRELAAWIVGRPGQEPTFTILRTELAKWLPEYMIPREFTILDKLPLTANGKLNRRALEKSAGRRLTAVTSSAPQNDAEKKLCAIWQKLLRLEHVGVHDNFFEVGGHSLLAIKLVTEMQIQFGAKIPLATLFAAPTVAELAGLIEGRERIPETSPINHFRGAGGGVPLFYVPGIHGFGFLPEVIAKKVGESGRFFDGFEYPGLTGPEAMPSRVEELAAALMPQLEKIWPEGPCFLAGYSFGGTVAFELARQLQAKGRIVPLLVLMDSSNHGARLRKRSLREMWRVFRDRSANGDIYSIGSSIMQASLNKMRFLLDRRLATRVQPGAGVDSIEKAMERANQQYHPGAFNGRVTLLKVDEPVFCGFRHTYEYDPLNGWGPVCLGGVEVIRVKGDHFTFLEEPAIHDIAEIMRRLLAQANEQIATPRRS
jgi:thioesterase domain-containing protein/acyl carrier protein